MKGEAAGPQATVRLGGITVAAMTEQQVIDHVIAHSLAGRGGLLLTPNVDHLRQVREGGPLAALYPLADLAVADGMPLVWASRLQRTPLPERVAGADLLWSLSEVAARCGVPIFLLGGRPGAAERAERALTNRYPGLRVAGTACPAPGFERNDASMRALVAHVVASRPGLVFTALGAPKQEVLNAILHEQLPSAWFLGVGAALDMAAGRVFRAPLILRRAGLEWLFRLLQEPRRLLHRYLVADLPVVGHLLVDALATRRRSIERASGERSA